MNYQWYLDGQPIPGADQQNHTYTVSGTYQVGSVNIGNCEVLSNEITVVVTSISNESEPTILILENQVLVSGIKNKAIVEWISSDGRIINNSQFSGDASIKIPDYSGKLILRIVSEDQSLVKKLILN